MNECNCVYVRENTSEVLSKCDADTEAVAELRPLLSSAFSGQYPRLPSFPEYWLTGSEEGAKAFYLALWKGDPEGDRQACLTVGYAEERSSSLRLWENLSLSIELETGSSTEISQPPCTPWLAIRKENSAHESLEYDRICGYLTAVLPWAWRGGEI